MSVEKTLKTRLSVLIRKTQNTCTRTLSNGSKRFRCRWRLPLLSGALVLEEQEAGEGGVHVSVEVGGAVEQQQPDLVASVQTDDDRVRRRAPVRDALRPDGRDHLAVLDYHHRRLRHTRHADSTETSGVHDCMSGAPIAYVNSTDVPLAAWRSG